MIVYGNIIFLHNVERHGNKVTDLECLNVWKMLAKLWFSEELSLAYRILEIALAFYSKPTTSVFG